MSHHIHLYASHFLKVIDVNSTMHGIDGMHWYMSAEGYFANEPQLAKRPVDRTTQAVSLHNDQH